MNAENVHKRTAELWKEVDLLEAQDEEYALKRKAVQLQISAKMSKIRKLGTMTNEQMAQLDVFEDAGIAGEISRPAKETPSRSRSTKSRAGTASSTDGPKASA